MSQDEKQPETEVQNEPSSNKLSAFIKNGWAIFKERSLAFTKRRPGLVYTFAFFVIATSIYVWRIKVNDHLSDKEYVKLDIETDEPINQITAIGKLRRNEEFNIDRSFLTKSIRVKPYFIDNSIIGPQFTLIGNSYGFADGDSALYLFDQNKWQKASIPVKPIIPTGAYNNDPFPYNIRIEYDHSAMKLYFDYSQVVCFPSLSAAPRIANMNTQQFISLAGTEGNNRVFFSDFGLCSFSDSKDSLLILPFQNQNSKADSKDSIESIPLPKGVVDFLPSGAGIAIHAYYNNEHSLYFTDGREKFISLVENTLLNNVLKEKDVTWINSKGVSAFLSQKSKSISIVSPDTKWKAKLFIASPDNYFEDITDVLSIKKDIVWLIGRTSNGYGIAKINTSEKSDSLSIVTIPNIDSESPLPSINVNDDGIIIVDQSAGEKIKDFRLYKYSNTDRKLDSLKITKFLDPGILNDLSVFEINIPPYSQKFEFTATSNIGIGASYQIRPTDDSSKPEVIAIKDNNAENPASIIWPARNFFSIESVPDYFFMVILIIGVIICYFFGLFYVMDFRNRDKGSQATPPPIFAELSTLQEKMGYTKKTMGSLKLRSEIMLWLGIVIGVAGMLAFVYSLKTFFSDSKSLAFNAEFTVRLLRTFAIFSFMEVFSFYFLKQYRIVFNEHKRFYSLYLRLMNYYQYMEVVQKFPDEANNTSYKEMRDAMLKDLVNMHDEPNLEKVNEFEKTMATDIVKALADKIPAAKP